MNIKGILFISFILLVFSLAAASAIDLGHVAISDSNSDGSILAHAPVTVSSHDDSVIIDDNLDDVAVDDSSIDDGPSVPDDGSSIDDGDKSIPDDGGSSSSDDKKDSSADVDGDINDGDSIIINITNDTPKNKYNDKPISNVKEASGSFEDLQSIIDLTPSGTTLCLSRDYKGSEDNGIILNKDLIIDGQGHTLDGNRECRIFHSTSGNIVLKNLKLINGYEDGFFPDDHHYYGGAILIEDNAKYTIENCLFENNWADDYGGAIANNANQLLTVKNCTFKSNTADDMEGGAIYSVNYVLIENSTFKDNTAYRGGAISLNRSTDDSYKIINCSFDSNRAVGSSIKCFGGAIYASVDNRDLTIEDSTFKSNYAEGKGGAIYTLYSAYITDCLFNSNSADGGIGENRGGAIFAEKDISIYYSIFNSNYAVTDGGAIYSIQNLYAQSCTFDSNRAVGSSLKCYGGAIRAEYVVLTRCNFTKNYSENHGGAIFTDTTPSEIKDCKFIDNKADEDGGAVYINDENTVTFKQCTFSNNRAGDEGGAIYLDSKSAHITLNNNLFIGNIANNGKAVYNYGLYDSISSNWWGGENPSSSNHMLVEWHFISDDYHTDSNPLSLAILSLGHVVKVGEVSKIMVSFLNSDGTEFSDADMPVGDINFTLPVGIKEISTDYLDNSVVLSYVAESTGSYDICVESFGQKHNVSILVVDALSSIICKDNVNGSQIANASPIDNAMSSVVIGLKSVVHPQFDGNFDIMAAFLSLLSVVGL